MSARTERDLIRALAQATSTGGRPIPRQAWELGVQLGLSMPVAEMLVREGIVPEPDSPMHRLATVYDVAGMASITRETLRTAMRQVHQLTPLACCRMDPAT